MKDLEEEEEAPVLLENGKAAGSVEGVLASFGLPAKGEMDPTKIMFIFYVVLFGMMLSDAAYGLIVSVACFVLLKSTRECRRACQSPCECSCIVEFPHWCGGFFSAVTLEMWWMWCPESSSAMRSAFRHFGLSR